MSQPENHRLNILRAIRDAWQEAGSPDDLRPRLDDICQSAFGKSLIGHVFGEAIEERLDAIEKRVTALEEAR